MLEFIWKIKYNKADFSLVKSALLFLEKAVYNLQDITKEKHIRWWSLLSFQRKAFQPFLSLLLLLMLAILASPGCSPTSDEGRKTVSLAPASKSPIILRVQAPLAPPSIPLVELESDPQVKISWYQGMDEAMSRIIQGEVDVSIIPVNSMAILHNKGVEIQLGAVSTWGILHLVSGDPQVQSLSDLKRKTVAVGAKGFSPDLVFRGLLAKQGLKPGQDLELIYSSSPEIAQMLVAKKLSLAVLPEPLLTSVLAKNSDLRLIANLEQEWVKAFPDALGLPQAGIAISKSFVKQNPLVWQSFNQKYAKSLEAYINNPERTGAKESEFLKLPADVIKQSLKRSNLKYSSAQEAKAAVNRYLEQLHTLDSDSVGGKVPELQGDFYLTQQN